MVVSLINQNSFSYMCIYKLLPRRIAVILDIIIYLKLSSVPITDFDICRKSIYPWDALQVIY